MNLGQYIGQQVQQAVGAALSNWWGQPWQDIHNAAQAGGTAGADELAQDMTPGSGGLLGFLEGLPVVGGLIADVIDPLKGVLGQAGGMIEGLALGWGLGSVVGGVMEPAFASAIASAHRAALDLRLDPETAAQLWVKGIMTNGQALADAADQGMDPNRVRQLHDGHITYPDVGQLLDMVNRGLLPDSDFVLAMQRHGYDLSWVRNIEALKRNLLSPADLALGHLRQDISDATLNSYAATLGVDPTDMQILIANTGEPLGAEELLFAYRRGIIDQPTLERGIRQSRIRDEWIPTLEALRFAPMSTADAARAVVQNYLDVNAGGVIAQQNGLDPNHWQYLVESYGRPLSPGEMSALYHRGLASQAQFDQAIRESDIKDKYVQQAFELARVLIPARQVVTALQHGALQGPDAIAYLMMEGYTQQDAQALVQTGVAEHHSTIKDLTRTDIIGLFTDRLMTRQQAHDQLVRLTYSSDVANWLLDLAEAKRQASLARTLQTQIKAMLQKGDIGRPEAISHLEAGGIDHQTATALVDEWEITHGLPSRTLSESVIVKLAEYQFMSPNQALQRLIGIGYSELDAGYLLALAGFDLPQTGVKFPSGTGGQQGGGGSGYGA